MKKTTWTLAIIAAILLFGGYNICDLFYDFKIDSDKWWSLRFKLINLCFLVLITIIWVLSKDYYKVFFRSLMMLCACDVIDRFIFGINYFIYSDYLIIITIITITIKDFLNVRRRKRELNN